MTVLDAIRCRRSVRSYSGREIPGEVMARLQEALRLAPSACNKQPWRFILITEPANRAKVAELCNGQKWMAEAPLIVVACGITGEAYQNMGGYGNSTDVDLAIAVDHLTLAAAEEGLGTCWIGAFDEKKLKQHLGIPDSVKVVALTPVGYPSGQVELNRPAPKRRKKPVEIFCNEHWKA